MGEHLTTILISIAGPAILGIFGFLWRVSNKLSFHEKQLEAHERRIMGLTAELSKLNDKAYSIVKNL